MTDAPNKCSCFPLRLSTTAVLGALLAAALFGTRLPYFRDTIPNFEGWPWWCAWGCLLFAVGFLCEYHAQRGKWPRFQFSLMTAVTLMLTGSWIVYLSVFAASCSRVSYGWPLFFWIETSGWRRDWLLVDAAVWAAILLAVALASELVLRRRERRT